MLEDTISNPAKLKSHALRVLKGYETELRTSKKVLAKNTKEIENVKRNINNQKNTEKRLLGKIKQIQQEIEQAKKKANIKEISNRLHGGSSQATSSKAPSIASKSDRSGNSGTQSYTAGQRYPVNKNLVRQNLLKKTSDMTNNRRDNTNKLLKTTPNIGTPPASLNKKTADYKPPVRPVVSSHNISKSPAKGYGYQPPKRVNTSVKS